jgi:hypothetical protein
LRVLQGFSAHGGGSIAGRGQGPAAVRERCPVLIAVIVRLVRFVRFGLAVGTSAAAAAANSGAVAPAWGHGSRLVTGVIIVDGTGGNALQLLDAAVGALEGSRELFDLVPQLTALLCHDERCHSVGVRHGHLV